MRSERIPGKVGTGGAYEGAKGLMVGGGGLGFCM